MSERKSESHGKIEEILDLALETSLRIEAGQPTRLRPSYDHLSSARGQIILGSRGTGKTTYLLHHLGRNNKWLYISADSPLIAQVGLYDIGRAAFRRDLDALVIDEAHFAKHWSRDIKALYDEYPKKRILVSDSSRIILEKGFADLSRRFVRVQMNLLSFREFLYLRDGLELPALDFLNLDHSVVKKIVNTGPILAWFKEYLEGGMRPIFTEGNYLDRQINIIEKTIFSDLPFVLPQVNENSLRLGNAVIGMLALSSVPTINVDSTCRDWEIGKETFYQLLSALASLSLITIVNYKASTKVQSKGAKIFLSDPSQYAALGGLKGNMREAYVAHELKSHFGEVFACKDETEGDFVAKKLKFEVGGVSKKLKSSDFVLCDDLEFPVGKKIPLWVLGMR